MSEIMDEMKAQDLMQSGISKVSDLVRATLGPYGRNVAIKVNRENLPLLTDDGVRVAELSLQALDGAELLGAQLVYQSSKRTEEEAGDGTSSSLLLASAIINNYMNYLDGCNGDSEFHAEHPNIIRRQLETASKYVLDELKKYVIKPEDITDEMMVSVANISAGRKDIGDMVGNIRNEIGRDGVVSIKYSRNKEDTVEYAGGYEFTGGLGVQELYVPGTNYCDFDKPLVLVVNGDIQTTESAITLINSYAYYCEHHNIPVCTRPLVVLCRHCTGDAYKQLVYNWFYRSDNQSIPIFPIEVPYNADSRGIMDDLAIITNAVMLEDTRLLTDCSEKSPALISERIGDRCDRITTNKKRTTIVSFSEPEDLERVNNQIEYLKGIQSSLINESDSVESHDLSTRIAKLSGKAAIIEVGALIESERTERKLKYDDAVLATRSAAKAGVVPGEGIAYLLARESFLNDIHDKDIGCSLGAAILCDALKSPFLTLLETSGIGTEFDLQIAPGSSVDSIEEFINNPSMCMGLHLNDSNIPGVDLNTGVFTEDYISDNLIYDPYEVVKSVIENAVSAACMFISTSNIVLIDEKSDK